MSAYEKVSSLDDGVETNGAAKENQEEPQLSGFALKFSYIRRLRYLLLLVILGIFQSTILPSVPYIINTFFAASHGGGDCEIHPKSKPCRMGAADAAFYHGWSDAASNIAAMLLALGNGSFSDVVGRRPMIRFAATIWLLPLACLSLHIFAGWTLWAYLVLVPMLLVFDLNGVYMALMSDLIPKAEERASAFGLFMAILMITMGVVMPIAFLIPKSCALAVSLTAAGMRLLYLITFFPETAPMTAATEERNGILATARVAYKVLTRHTFIFRMTIVLTLAGLGSSGYAIVMPPFMTGYLGFERKDKLKLFLACGASMALAFLCLLGPLSAFFGDVGVLRISLTAAVLFPALCPLCTKIDHLVALAGLFAGPCCLAYPMVMAIKSNLVSQDEQGLVQGAIASIGRGTATIGFIFFSILFKLTTKGGEIKDNTVLIGPFLAIGCINAVAALLAFSLPKAPPPPTKTSDCPGNGHQGVQLSDVRPFESLA